MTGQDVVLIVLIAAETTVRLTRLTLAHRQAARRDHAKSAAKETT